MSWLISYVIACLICEECEASENYKLKKITHSDLNQTPTALRLLVGRIRHGPFDILGGAWNFFKKNFLALVLTKKNNIAQWHSEQK